jgi:hypothetical protein
VPHRPCIRADAAPRQAQLRNRRAPPRWRIAVDDIGHLVQVAGKVASLGNGQTEPHRTFAVGQRDSNQDQPRIDEIAGRLINPLAVPERPSRVDLDVGGWAGLVELPGWEEARMAAAFGAVVVGVWVAGVLVGVVVASVAPVDAVVEDQVVSPPGIQPGPFVGRKQRILLRP